MLKFWKLFNGFTLLLDAPDDGGGGGGDDYQDDDVPTGDHPEFEIPAGVGGTDDKGGKPTDPGGNDDGRPKGEGGEKPKGGPKPGQETVDNIPKHRLDAVIQQRDQLQQRYDATDAEVKRLKQLIAANLGIVDPSAPPKAKALNAREQAIQNRILELVPWLKDLQGLAEKAGSLVGLADSAPDFERQQKQYWGRVAQTYMDSMESAVASLILGDGKTAKDLTPQLKARYRVDFMNWVQSDPQRVERYESIDRTLVDDYRKDLDDAFIAPVRRQYGADVVRRQRQTEKLPVGGGGQAPVAGNKPKSKPLDEDAAADAAWKNLQERLATR